MYVAIERGRGPLLRRGKVFWSRTKWRVERGSSKGGGPRERGRDRDRRYGGGGVREGIETYVRLSVSLGNTYLFRYAEGCVLINSHMFRPAALYHRHRCACEYLQGGPTGFNTGN